MIEMGIEDTITYIDTQISELISKMINARTKHIDAINKILTKIQSIQSQANLSYRQGRTYDLMSKVEDGVNQQFDIEKPRYQLSYTGSKMTLSYDSESIDVPSVPIFVFEPQNVPNRMQEIGEEMLLRNILVVFPLSANIEEEADIENAYAKYYRVEFANRVLNPSDVTFAAPKSIPLPNPILTPKGFEADEGIIYHRILHIGGVEYFFSIGCYFGRFLIDITFSGGYTFSDQKYDGIMFHITTDYDGDVNFQIFNNRYGKGNLVEGIYQRFVGLIGFQNNNMMVEIE